MRQIELRTSNFVFYCGHAMQPEGYFIQVGHDAAAAVSTRTFQVGKSGLAVCRAQRFKASGSLPLGGGGGATCSAY